MARKVEDFISAYVTYADNGHAPRAFHLWSAISIVAGALERKVWLPWDETFSYFPNLFIFLVAHPGIGKSSALNKAAGLLQDVNRTQRGNIFFVPSQVTEAKFIDLMSQAQSFGIGSQITYHSSGYYLASEASSDLKNLYGDFIASMTNFYDCPSFWEKATMKDGTKTLTNVCLNLLAGTTFDYLGKLITDDNIMGGFASRVTYVMFREKLVRDARFQGGVDAEDNAERNAFRAKLVADLGSIHQMRGSFRGTPEFGARFESWYPKFEEERQAHPSEKMQSLMVRKQTTLMKLCMILSASRSDSRVLEPQDWDLAMTYLDQVEKDLPGMLREAKSSNTETAQGLVQAVLRALDTRELVERDLRNNLILRGFEPLRISHLLNQLVVDGAIARTGTKIKLLIDPNAHL